MRETIPGLDTLITGNYGEDRFKGCASVGAGSGEMVDALQCQFCDGLFFEGQFVDPQKHLCIPARKVVDAFDCAVCHELIPDDGRVGAHQAEHADQVREAAADAANDLDDDR